MIINNITISKNKLIEITEVLPNDVLHNEYSNKGFSDREISEKYNISVSWVCKLRKIFRIKTDKRYHLRRNYLRHVPLTDMQKQFLYGTLLGDSCIAVHKSGTGYWVCRHSTNQERYLLKQADMMKPFTAKVFYGKRAFEKGGKKFPYVDARTYALPQFTELRDELYPDGKKRITSNWLEKLTPMGFAFWFMDDGSTTGYGFDITTYDSFFKTQESIDVLYSTLKLRVSINWQGDEGKIHVLKDSHDLAWSYIKGHLTEDLFHKIPKRFKNISIIR